MAANTAGAVGADQGRWRARYHVGRAPTPLPGPGSIAIHVQVADALFVGDALTTRQVLTGTRGPQPAPFTDDPAQALASLAHLDGITATWVLPGHGTPWNRGVEQAVQEVTKAVPKR